MSKNLETLNSISAFEEFKSTINLKLSENFIAILKHESKLSSVLQNDKQELRKLLSSENFISLLEVLTEEDGVYIYDIVFTPAAHLNDLSKEQEGLILELKNIVLGNLEIDKNSTSANIYNEFSEIEKPLRSEREPSPYDSNQSLTEAPNLINEDLVIVGDYHIG